MPVRLMHAIAWNRNSQKFALKLSEKSRWVPNQGSTGLQNGCTSLILVVADQWICSRNLAPTTFQTVSQEAFSEVLRWGQGVLGGHS